MARRSQASFRRYVRAPARWSFALSILDGLEEEPGVTFGLVEPVLDQAGRGEAQVELSDEPRSPA